MKRDELIEELKKAPSNGDVYINLKSELECPRCSRLRTIITTEAEIGRIQTIPNIVLECSE